MKYFEFRGGLGDIIYSMYDNNKYLFLESLDPSERATLAIMSNNPGIKELFLWHPKAAQFDILEIQHKHPWEVEDRKTAGLPEKETELSGVGGLPVTYYPSPGDLDLIRNVQTGPYVVFSLTAGLPYRNVPLDVAQSAAITVREMGFKPILVGRNYQKKGEDLRFETRLDHAYGATDLIDRLTVPGTARLIEGADGVFCHEGAVMHLAWRLKKPCFVVPSHKQTHWKPDQWVCWGLSQPRTAWSFDNEFTREKMADWIKTKVMTKEQK